MKSTKYIFIVLGLLTAYGCGKKAPPGNYDLACKSISYAPNPVYVGNSVIFTYTIYNIGNNKVPAGTYEVDLFVDGKKVSNDYDTPSLVSNGVGVKYSKAKGFYDFRPRKPGTYKYKLRIDPFDRLTETNEDNNIIEGTFTVAPLGKKK